MDPVPDPQHWLGGTKKQLHAHSFLLKLGGTGPAQELAVPEEGIHH
jgi:hypothetical protein